MRFKIPREAYIRDNAIKVCDKHSDAVAYLSADVRGRPCAVIFFGKQAKPVANYAYRSEAERERSVADYFGRAQAWEKRKSDARQARKDFRHNVRIGDIFAASWGYDQTNVNFFQVIEVKGKFATVREIAQHCEERGRGADVVVPQTDKFLEPRYEGDEHGLPLRRLVQQAYGGQACLKINETYSAYQWGERDPITGTVLGRGMHQTASGWGH